MHKLVHESSSAVQSQAELEDQAQHLISAHLTTLPLASALYTIHGMLHCIPPW